MPRMRGDEWLSYFYARKAIHVNKMAMVLSASRRNDLIITLKELEESVALFDSVEKDMENIFGRPLIMERAELNTDLWKELKKKLLISKRIPEKIIFSFCMKYIDNYNNAKAVRGPPSAGGDGRERSRSRLYLY